MHKVMKWARLYWFELDAPDIDRFFFVRLFRKFGIYYIPFTLRFCEKLFLREGKSRYARLLLNFCNKHGIESYVVQEGVGKIINSVYGYAPLHSDYFVCQEKDYQHWIDSGIPKGQLLIHHPQKKPHEYSGIVFMHPLYLNDNLLHNGFWDGSNLRTISVIERFMKEDVVFKLHPKNREYVARLIPKNRIVDGYANDLIMKYDKIYCFRKSSVCFDCEMLGKKYEVVDE